MKNDFGCDNSSSVLMIFMCCVLRFGDYVEYF